MLVARNMIVYFSVRLYSFIISAPVMMSPTFSLPLISLPQVSGFDTSIMTFLVGLIDEPSQASSVRKYTSSRTLMMVVM